MNTVTVKIAGLICTLHRNFLAVTRRGGQVLRNEGAEEYVWDCSVSRFQQVEVGEIAQICLDTACG